MIKIGDISKIQEVPKKKENHSKNNIQDKQKLQQVSITTIRPEVVDAKVYKLKSAFVKNSVFITLSYVNEKNDTRPIEIFINSKDLTRAPEYVVLTRLVSAIFRRSHDPMFILEELHGIHDPNGGSFKDGKYYHSFYAEVADVIERFFYDVKIIEPQKKDSQNKDQSRDSQQTVKVMVNGNQREINEEFRICPSCTGKSLKIENGCDMCMECGYSKCDK